MKVQQKKTQMHPQVHQVGMCASYHDNTHTHKFCKDSKWLIDSGATYHIIIDASLYETTHFVHNTSVSLPNGHKALVTHTQLRSMILLF